MILYTFGHVKAQNLVRNPGFETGTFTPFWATWTGMPNSSSAVVSGPAYSGNYCAELTGDSVYLYQPVSLEPNTTYKLSAAIKTELGELTYLGANNFGYDTGKSLAFTSTTYKTDSLTFTTGGNPYNNPRIYIWKVSGPGRVWVDDFSLIAVTSGNLPDEPGGMGSYYVSPLGNDNNSGISPEEAWKTIDKVNQVDFEPGDRILFEGGETFKGNIRFTMSDSGTPENQIEVGSYGNGRAVIDAQTGTGFSATDCEHVVVRNLNFTGDGRKTGNTGNGLTFSYCSNIVVDSVEVSGFQHSGLTARNVGYNYRFTNIYAHDNGYAGIYVSGTDKFSLIDIYIGYCVADNNPGDPTVTNNHSGNGIFAYNASNLTIEYCKASNNGGDMPWNGNGPGGIWVAEADSVLIQYCISHDNKTSPGALDGLGFDLDGGTTNTVIQYCLSYNNQGAGYGIFQYAGATDWKNNTVRYCISENDGNVTAPGSVYFWNGSGNANKFQGFEFYNNVVYNANGPALAFLDHKNLNFNFRNNIFVSKSGKVYDRINGEKFQGNNWYTLSNSSTQDSIDFINWALANNQEILNGEIVGIYANPRFINPGNSTLTDPLLLETVDDYKVKAGSVVIDKGLDLESHFNINPGNRDYFGNLIKQGMAFNMGVDQFADKQEISLGVGWNIFSANLAPNDSNLMNILQPLINAGKLKKVMDEAGNAIEDRGIFGGWTNGIGNIKTTEGYAINVTSQSTLEIYGNPVQLPIEIPLSKGWNIISWPAQFEQDGMDVFQTLIDEGKLKKVMNEEGQTIEDWGTFGGWKNNIGNLAPGEGFKVNVTDDCTLTVDENIVKSQAIIPKSKTTTHFISSYIGNGFNHMNINVVNLPVNIFNTGDELAVFDKDICVGAVKIQDHHLRNFSVSIVTSASDNTGMKGFTEGNSFFLKLWDSRQNREIVLEPEILKGTSTFAKNETTFASLEKYVKTGLEGIYGSNYNEINCFPNPFSDEITIEIILGADSEVFVEVLNQLGQQVKILYPQNELNKGNHQIKWNGKNGANQNVPAGIYFVRAIIGNKILFDKVVYQ
jgi:hypothetical protein